MASNVETEVIDVLDLLMGIFGGKLTASSAGLAATAQAQQGFQIASAVLSTLPAGNTVTAAQTALTAASNLAGIAIAQSHITATPAAPAPPTGGSLTGGATGTLINAAG